MTAVDKDTKKWTRRSTLFTKSHPQVSEDWRVKSLYTYTELGVMVIQWLSSNLLDGLGLSALGESKFLWLPEI